MQFRQAVEQGKNFADIGKSMRRPPPRASKDRVRCALQTNRLDTAGTAPRNEAQQEFPGRAARYIPTARRKIAVRESNGKRCINLPRPRPGTPASAATASGHDPAAAERLPRPGLAGHPARPVLCIRAEQGRRERRPDRTMVFPSWRPDGDHRHVPALFSATRRNWVAIAGQHGHPPVKSPEFGRRDHRNACAETLPASGDTAEQRLKAKGVGIMARLAPTEVFQ